MFYKKETLLNFDIKIFNRWSLSEVLLITGVSAALLWSVYFAFVAIFVPYQIEYHEGTALAQTWLFLRRQNPFVLENQPFGMNNYGMGYSLVVLPFAAIFGNTLLVHRSVTFGFIAFSALAGYFIVYRARRDRLFAIVCAAFIMVGLITGDGIGAVPAAMGVFLFLAAVLIPFVWSFDRKSLILSALVSFGAFYTKPYFVLSFGIVVSYLFFFVSKKKSLLYGSFYAAGFMAFLLIVKSVFPTYFINTIIGNIFNSNNSLDHLFYQLRELFISFLPILFILFWIIQTGSFREPYLESDHSKNLFVLNIYEWNKPFLKYSLNYLFYSFAFSFMSFVFILGRHKGNNMYYSYQLILPLFFCWFFGYVAHRNRMRLFLVLIVLINLFAWEGKLLSPNILKQDSSKEWAELFDYMRSSKRILNAPTVVSEVIALGLTPLDSGQTIFFYNVRPYPDNILSNISYQQIRTDGFIFEKSINRQIEKQKFDLIITIKDKFSFFDYDLVNQYYSQISEITVQMPYTGIQWTMLVWKPKPQ